MPNTVAISPTGDAYVDSILGGVKWSVNSLTYSFPTSGSYYGPAYGSGEVNSFLAFTATQQAAVRSILTQYSSVINFTFTETTETATNHGDLRYAESAVPSTAWAYTPSTDPIGGDAWFGSTNHWYDNPVPGSYGWLTMMHETGHTLGLKHPQTNMGNGFGVMPADHDSVEYTVMSYRSFVGAGLTGLSNETYGYPTTLMMYDVAALQDMYGANYTTNSGDTVYKWNPLTGQEYINGIGQAVPGANRIFMNVWDGGGHDTYDFSNYTTNLKVDLSPGGWTVTSTAQLANLGGGHFAVGNISNSLLFQGNTASLIDDAIGGSGNDTITGNVADNHLTGGAGNDILDGGAGNDTAVYSGQQSNYQMVHNANGTWTVTDLRAGSPDGTDTLTNIENLQFSNGVVALNNVQTLPTLQVPTIASFSADSGLVGDRITNDNTLTFTGGATAGSTVKLFDGATLLGTVTANASGGWTFTTALLADGAHNFTVSAADASGNTSATSSPFAITVDTVAPNAPTITSVSPDSNIAGDGVTNAATLTLHGSAEVGSVVQIFDGMTLLGSTSTDATGAWTFTSYDPTSAAPAFGDPDEVALDETAAGAGTGTALAEGAHTFTVKAVDAAGNVSAASAPVNMTVDTVAPAAPTIASFSTDTGAIGDGITSDNTLLLSGTAEANSVVKIYDGATLLGSATTNAGGSWSFTTAVLADGAHTFSAKATDVAGNTGAVSASLNVTVDTVAPSAPVIANFSNDSGTVGDGITNDNTLLLTGTAAVGSTIQIYDGATLLGNTVANVGGAWSFATATLADGAHAFMAKASDAAGNISTASASLNVVVDTMAPGAPVIGSFSNDTGTVGDGITSDNTLVLAGTAAAGSTVQLYDGGTLLGSTTASAGGAWNFSTAVLADGTHAFTAKATDAAGNASAASSVLNVAVDTAAPNVPVISGFSNDTGVVGDGITGANVLNLAGVATPGGTVQVYDGATLLGNASVTAGGAWAFTTPTLADGSHALSAKVTDIAGNASSASASLNVVVDTVAPNAPVVASFSNDSGVVGDGITNANMLTLAGTAAANSTIQVYDGATLLGITSTNASGAWNFATATLTDGAHAFSAKAIDAAGNISVASAALGVSIDTVAPNAPVIGSFSTDTGVVGDGVTSDNTLVLAGTAAAGSNVQVFDGATLLGTATANAGGVWNFATATLSDGAHSFSAKAGDAAGNISAASASLSVVVDTVAPSAPSISNFSTDTGTVGDGITSDNTLILTGTAAAGSSVQVYDGATLLGSAAANAGGTWNFATATLNDGAHSFTAKATDVAGNTSGASTAISVTIDTVAPNAPVISSFSNDTGTVGDAITSDNTLLLTGSAAAGSSVQVYDGVTLLGSATANASGVWSFATATLADGAHAFSAKASDAAGNTSASSAVLSITVDTAAPNAPVIANFSNDTGAVGDGITGANALNLSGTAAAGSVVQIYDGVTLLGNATAGVAGAWSFATTTLADGNHAFTAKAIDAAGNTSFASAPLNVTVDTVAPTAPVIASFPNDTGTVGDGITTANDLTLNGTAAAGSAVQVFDGATLLGSATADAGGLWNFATGLLAGGAHAFTARAVDLAGNVSSASTVLAIAIIASTVPTVTSFSPDTAIAGDGVTNASSITLTGTADANNSIDIYDGARLLGTVTSNSNGNWSFVTPPLSEGTHAFTAKMSDGAGHSIGSATALTVTVDTIAPYVPVVASFSPDSGIVGDGITNSNRLVLNGGAAAGSTVQVFDGTALIGTTTANATGGWSFTTGALTDGAHAFKAIATDVAGNSSAMSSALAVTVDTVASTTPKITSFADDTGVVGDGLTNDRVLTLSGTAEANATVNVFDGVTWIASTTANANGVWSLVTPSLTEGAHAFSANSTDAAANTGAASVTLNVMVDTTAPDAPVVASFSGDTGVIGDGITSANVLTLSGTAAAGSLIQVYDGASLLGNATANSAGSWSFTTSALGDGAHAFAAKATDAAGNASPLSLTLNVTVDTVAPATPAIVSFSPDTSVIGDGITDAHVLTLTGTAESNITVKIYDGTTLLGQTKADAAGAWNFTTATLSSGNHKFTAAAADVAGNSSVTGAALSVVVDPNNIVDQAPTVSGTGLATARNQTVSATQLFTASDADGDAITSYQFYDATTNATSGHFAVNGVAQAAQTVFSVTAAQLAQTSFQAGTTGDSLMVRAFDGTTWSAWTDISPSLQNHAAVVATSAVTAGRSQTVAASSLFSANDADGDAIVSYQFYDASTSATSGNFVVNGVVQAAQTILNVSASQLAQTNFVTGSTGDSLQVRAYDGTSWSAWTDVSVAIPDHAAIVTTAAATIARNQSVAASSLFSVSDSDGDAITSYQFYDGTTASTSGHFVVNGVTQAAQTVFSVTAAQLAQTSFQAGTTGDGLMVRAYDGTAWSDWTDISASIPNHAAVMTTSAVSAARNQTVSAATLFSTNDADGDAIVSYQFYDGTTSGTSGHFAVNGVDQTAQTIFTVTPAQLAQTSFHTGTTSDSIMARAFDGTNWSDWTDVSIAIPNHAPVVTTNTAPVTAHQDVAVSSLFSASDADGDAITAYQFWDNTGDASSGHFMVNGVEQAAHTIFEVSAAQLSQTDFQTGSGVNDAYMRVFDGTTWSDWTSMNVDVTNNAPTVTASVTVASPDQSLAASSLFSVSDVEHNAITAYQFWDQTTDASSGHFVVNGVDQSAQSIIDVSAAELSQTSFKTGVGSDDLYARAFDGTSWSDWTEFNVVTSAPNAAPANTLQIVGTANNDALVSTSANEQLTGGSGSDTFVFAANFGKDVITDFQASGTSHDVIAFSQSVFNDFAAVLAHATQVGADVVIAVDPANSVTIKNVAIDKLQSDHFHII